MIKLSLDVDNVIIFDENGRVEHSIFIGRDDDPVLQQTLTLEEMALEFLETRSINDRLAVYHMEEAQQLCDSLEDALALVKAAMK